MIEAEKEEIDEFTVLTNVNIRAKNATFAKAFGLENTIVETRALIVRERAGINCGKTELPGKTRQLYGALTTRSIWHITSTF